MIPFTQHSWNDKIIETDKDLGWFLEVKDGVRAEGKIIVSIKGNVRGLCDDENAFCFKCIRYIALQSSTSRDTSL